MKAITAERDWIGMAYKQLRGIAKETAAVFKAAGINKPATPVKARKKASVKPVEETAPSAPKTEKKNLFVLFGLQPSWDMDRIATGLRELKQSFESPKVIICSERYLDELVHRCEEFDYDAYLLTCDGGEELKKAVNNVEAGKLYLSRSVITSYCITRRREWAS